MARRKKGRAPKGQGSVTTLVKDEKYRIRVPIGRTEDGATRHYSETFYGTREQADERRAELYLARKTLYKPENITLKELLDNWHADEVQGQQAERTADLYKRQGKQIAKEFGSDIASKMKPLRFQEYFRGLREGGASDNTIRIRRTVLRRAFDYAVRMEIVTRNPILAVKLGEVKSKPGAVWTPAQANAFLETSAGNDDRYYALWYLALTTGMRIGEILGLQWPRVILEPLEEARLNVRHTLIKSGSEPVLKEPKTKGSVRTIPLDEGQVSVLKAHKARQNKERLFYGQRYSVTGMVFTTPDGRAVHVNNLRKRHFFPLVEATNERLREEAAKRGETVDEKDLLPRIRLHDLRHTFATIALENGESLKTVSEILGHASIKITGDVYSHASQRSMRNAASTVSRVIRSG